MTGWAARENSDMAVDGFYAGYMTGAEGNGFSMFVFTNGSIVGADPMGVQFDGSYVAEGDNISAKVDVRVPGGETVIQGAAAGPAGLTYTVDFVLPGDFADRDFIRLDTPLGAVNLKLRKLRDIGAAG